MLALVGYMILLERNASVTRTGRSKVNGKHKGFSLVTQLVTKGWNPCVCQISKWSASLWLSLRYNHFRFLKTKVVPKFQSRSRDPTPWRHLANSHIMVRAVVVYGLPKFEVSSFRRSGYIRGSQNLKGHVTSPLDPFDLICIFTVRAPSPQYVHKIASWSVLMRLRYCDFTISPIWFEIAYSRPFWERFGAYFFQMASPFILTQKGTFARKHVVWAISVCASAAVWPVDMIEKKIRTVEKSQKCYISHIWGESLAKPICRACGVMFRT